MSKTIISVEKVSKSYQIGQYHADSLREAVTNFFQFRRQPAPKNFWALRNVSFTVEEGDVVGIIGRNGSGKSTLLKIVSQITPPTTGKLTMHGRVASLLEVGTGFNPELTGRENIYLNGVILGMKRREIRKKFSEIVEFADIGQFLDTPVKRYSSGMYMRLAFAIAVHLEPDILVVDEVLSVGDAQFQKKSLAKMEEVRKQGRTVLFVSHNMKAIESLCNKALLLEKGKTKGIVPVQGAIEAYTPRPKINRGECHFPGKPLRYVKAAQKGETLEITANYYFERLTLPVFGFVIADALGAPICGTNPLINPPEAPFRPQKKGTVVAKIDQPKLLNGTYSLSVWLGDDKQEFFSHPNCLTFEVNNMVKGKQLPAPAVGPVFPSCQWRFE